MKRHRYRPSNVARRHNWQQARDAEMRRSQPWNQPGFWQRFVQQVKRAVKFIIDGIKAACAWIAEHLPEYVARVRALEAARLSAT